MAGTPPTATRRLIVLCANALRERNAEWGVRDINESRNVAEKHGMLLAAIEQMPANNMILIFERRGRE